MFAVFVKTDDVKPELLGDSDHFFELLWLADGRGEAALLP